jgi:hypothetical protein
MENSEIFKLDPEARCGNCVNHLEWSDGTLGSCYVNDSWTRVYKDDGPCPYFRKKATEPVGGKTE